MKNKPSKTAITAIHMPVHAEILGKHHSSRSETEQFIQQIFRQHYDATIQHFMPELLALRNNAGQLTAALGIRPALDQPLFLEHYLTEPVESCMKKVMPVFEGDIKRENIIEVGNLAASSAGGSRWLITALTAYLQGAGYDWVTFTALPSLKNAFRKMGLKVITLADADKNCLAEQEQQAWGNYYDDKPQVVTVNVHHAYGVLEKQLRFQQAMQFLQRLWQQAYLLGNAHTVFTTVTNAKA